MHFAKCPNFWVARAKVKANFQLGCLKLGQRNKGHQGKERSKNGFHGKMC